MKTFLLSVFWLLLALAVAGVATWYLAFGPSSDFSEDIVAPIEAPFEIEWVGDRDAVVSLQSRNDQAFSLGLVHGLSRPWLMALYRQAALGRLAEWFGPAAVAWDLHSQTMALAPPDSVLRRTLSRDALDMLERYAQGVRVAQGARSWDLRPVTVLVGVRPEPWTASNSVAVERLLAWLSTPIPTDSGVALDSLSRTRAELAEFLGLAGMTESAVWSTGNGNLYARLTLGDSGIPPVITLRILDRGGLLYEGATLAGSPFLFCGRNKEQAWCKPPGGELTTAVDSADAKVEYLRVNVLDGSRVVGARRIRNDKLALGNLAVAWSGLRATSDSDQWTRIPPVSNHFGLSGLTGLVTTADSIAALGSRLFRSGGVVMSSPAPEALLLAGRIDLVRDTLREPASLLLDTGSLVPDSLRFLIENDSSGAGYLRNWDGLFRSTSVAASQFDLRAAYGPEAASDSLIAWFGSDPRMWRWELDPGVTLRYPGGNLADLPTRYGPVAALRSGHPTSPAWSDSRAWHQSGTGPWRGASAWEAYLNASDPEPMPFRRPDVPYSEFLGRERSAPVRAELRMLLPSPENARTQVRPDS